MRGLVHCSALAALFLACESPAPAKKPSAPAAAGVDASTPAPAPPRPLRVIPDAGPPPVDTGLPPTAEDALGPVRVHFRIREPAALFARDYLYQGLPDGGTWTRLERKRAGRNEIVRLSRSGLDGAEVGELLTALDEGEWWDLKDAWQTGAPLVQTLDIRRGGTRHRFVVRGPCWCDERCACPHGKALDAANVFFHRAKVDAPEVFPPTSLRALAAPELVELEDGGTPLREVVCDTGPGRWLTCEKKRCIRQGKQAACFASPFEPDGGAEWMTVKTERKTRGAPSGVWAFRSATGQECVQRPWPSAREQWVCNDERPKPARLFWVGKTLFLEAPDPDWGIEVVTEAWR